MRKKQRVVSKYFNHKTQSPIIHIWQRGLIMQSGHIQFLTPRSSQQYNIELEVQATKGTTERITFCYFPLLCGLSVFFNGTVMKLRTKAN